MTSLDTSAPKVACLPTIDPEERAMITAAQGYKYVTFSEEVADVRLILVLHEVTIGLHSQFLCIHSGLLKSMLGACVEKGVHYIFMAKNADHVLWSFNIQHIQDVLGSMYNYQTFCNAASKYTFAQWRAVLAIEHYLELKIIGPQIRLDLQEAVNKYPEGPLKGKPLSVSSFFEHGFPTMPGGTHANKMYEMMSNAIGWDNPSWNSSVFRSMPYPECWAHFGKWAIMNLCVYYTRCYDLNEVICLPQQKSFVDTDKIRRFASPYSMYSILYQWLAPEYHAKQCGHCIEVAKKKAEDVLKEKAASVAIIDTKATKKRKVDLSSGTPSAPGVRMIPGFIDECDP